MSENVIGVTGATGFIGSSLVKKLLTKGYRVKALVRENKDKLPSGIEIVKGSLSDLKAINSFTSGIDTLVHLAARQLLPEQEMVKDNIDGTYNLISSSLDKNISQIVYLSTIAVYGESQGSVFTEDDAPHPNTIYGLTKYISENIVNYWSRKSGNTITVLRPFNIYGPGNKKGVIYNFYKSFLESGKITIFGDGLQTRDYLFVEDVVEAICLSISNKTEGIINLGTGQSYSLLDLVKIFGEVLQKEIPIEFKPSEAGKVLDIQYDISKPREKLAWAAKVNLEEGLRKTLGWYKVNLPI